MFGNLKGYLQLFKDNYYAKSKLGETPHLFDSLSAYCMFIGYPRSSHSLIGSLIDAHPDAIIAHEQDVLKYVKYGFSKEKIFHLLLRNSKEFTEMGRTWTGYSYAVPSQYQGRYETLRIIGDKRGANSARRFQRNPAILQKLKTTIDIPIKMIHVVRNPYDNISTMAFRNNGSIKENVTKAVLKEEIKNYFALVNTVDWVQEQLLENDIFHIKIEAFMANPKELLEQLCRFLDLTPDEKYLNDCAAIVYNKPHKTREEFPWDAELIQEVDKRMEEYPFFAGYDFRL